MSTPSLTDFLLARIAEDERMARGAAFEFGSWDCEWVDDPDDARCRWEVVDRDAGAPIVEVHRGSFLDAEHIARHDPARVLAECEAKRRIVEEAALWGCQKTMCKILALPYADHPDYRQEWKP